MTRAARPPLENGIPQPYVILTAAVDRSTFEQRVAFEPDQARVAGAGPWL
jgi:tagatose-1,6-bisphosphate aldolase